jgi:CRP-like cAMP-binding protein
MSHPHQSDIRNYLLASCSAEDFAGLAPHLEPVELQQGFPVSFPGRTSEYSYFPDVGIGSIVVTTSSGRSTEICLFGREGMAPVSSILGAASSPYSVFMQVAGFGHRIENAYLLAACSQSVALRGLLTRYAQAAAVQTAYTAYTNAADHIERRLARWLLMCLDRTDGNTVTLTHESLSTMLAVRRQSVTTTLHMMEGKHAIRSTRGEVTVTDRRRLEALAGEAYGPAEREYHTLVGRPL